MNVEAIPAAMRERDQWVLWRREERGGKLTKVPHRAGAPERKASTTDPASWSDFATAAAMAQTVGVDGLGYVFAADDPFVGVDLDGAIGEDGELTPEAERIVDELDSYTERSPSGRGVHVIVRGDLNGHGDGARSGPVEVYGARRFFTFTADHLPGTPGTIEPRQEQLDAVLARVLGPSAGRVGDAAGISIRIDPGAQAPAAKLAALIDNSETFRKTWERRRDFPSQSEHDQSIANLTADAGWGDQEIADAIVAHRRAGGADLKRPDYYERTIAKARERRPRPAAPDLGAYAVTWTDDKTPKLILPDVPEPDDAAGQAAWLTSVLRLDPRHPVTGARHQGQRGPDGHVVIRRAEAPAIRIEPAELMTSGRRLLGVLPFQLIPTDGEPYGFKDEHARRIAHVTRLLCGIADSLTEAQETTGIVGTFLSDATAIEGHTTYGETGERFAALEALQLPADPVTGRPIRAPHYLIDSQTGELVIRVGDLQTAARRHVGSSLRRGWLDARMDDLGWSRVEVQGYALPGRDGRRTRHLRVLVYRGHLPGGGAVNT